jgi:hypothetical protein
LVIPSELKFNPKSNLFFEFFVTFRLRQAYGATSSAFARGYGATSSAFARGYFEIAAFPLRQGYGGTRRRSKQTLASLREGHVLS